MNLTQKIIKAHLTTGEETTTAPDESGNYGGEAKRQRRLMNQATTKSSGKGEMTSGKEIGLRVDQTLTQDATGTMAYLQFEAMGVDKVKTKISASYVDHNMLQTDFMNADDHAYLQSVAAKYGIYFSRPGNGICHQVHLERFSAPGQILLGSDSHTPTCGSACMLAIGVGGLDVAVAMAGYPFYLTMPKVVGIHLTGKLKPWVTAKDIIFELLRRLTVKGGIGRILEYYGDGVKSLSVPERATITNMGAELGATTSIFPSDENTRQYLMAQGRGSVWKKLSADPEAVYDENIVINLDELEPLIAKPHSPDNVVKVREVEGLQIHQVCIGSCTNSSYSDLMTVAKILAGKSVHPGISVTITPGSKQVYSIIAKNGALHDLITSGCRILESACGPCIGMGQAPPSGGVSVRSFNRNFEGRAGTPDAQVYLASPETCAACALTGVITDPRKLGKYRKMSLPKKFLVDDSGIINPLIKRKNNIEIMRGPNIKPIPQFEPMPVSLDGIALLKVGDNITTDHIMPAGAKILPLRSNIPAIADFVFYRVDPTFVKRTKEAGGGFVVGGENYGQGSSREHAALAPKYLGLKAVIAKSFARIHWANLINFGILPLTFVNPDDYELLGLNIKIRIPGVKELISRGETIFYVEFTSNSGNPTQIKTTANLTSRQREILLAGGLLNKIRQGVRPLFL